MKYGAILADPPWGFLTYGKHRTTPHRTCVDHYETMTLEQMSAIDLPTAKDCALFMWVVDSHVPEALQLGTAWGFTFKTRAFTWRKTTGDGSRARISMGYWTRKQTELCFLFTRGKPRRLSKGVREIIDAPRREHSRKPDEQYERIEALVGGPYLEMFARQRRPGWDVWGNEVDKFTPAPTAEEFFA